MDNTPVLNINGTRRRIENTSCGHMAMRNRDRYAWQSRLNLARPPDLVDLRQLARQIRAR